MDNRTGEFEFEDGTILKFNKFVPSSKHGTVIQMIQPPKGTYRYTSNIGVYVDDEFAKLDEIRRKCYNMRDITARLGTSLNGIFVGITFSEMDIGIPKGVYVPFQFNPHLMKFEVITYKLAPMDHLILEDAIAEESTKNKVYKQKPKEEEEG
jgi:hypothetical protein